MGSPSRDINLPRNLKSSLSSSSLWKPWIHAIPTRYFIVMARYQKSILFLFLLVGSFRFVSWYVDVVGILILNHFDWIFPTKPTVASVCLGFCFIVYIIKRMRYSFLFFVNFKSIDIVDDDLCIFLPFQFHLILIPSVSLLVRLFSFKRSWCMHSCTTCFLFLNHFFKKRIMLCYLNYFLFSY